MTNEVFFTGTIDQMVERACQEPTLIDALSFIAIIENQLDKHLG
jgi:hypothetical protein